MKVASLGTRTLPPRVLSRRHAAVTTTAWPERSCLLVGITLALTTSEKWRIVLHGVSPPRWGFLELNDVCGGDEAPERGAFKVQVSVDSAQVSMHKATASVTSEMGAEVICFGVEAFVSLLDDDTAKELLASGESAADDVGGGEGARKIYILYATETGTAEQLAEGVFTSVHDAFGGAGPTLDINIATLEEFVDSMECAPLFAPESIVLIVSSTFGVGNAPANGVAFSAWLEKVRLGKRPATLYTTKMWRE